METLALLIKHRFLLQLSRLLLHRCCSLVYLKLLDLLSDGYSLKAYHSLPLAQVLESMFKADIEIAAALTSTGILEEINEFGSCRLAAFFNGVGAVLGWGFWGLDRLNEILECVWGLWEFWMANTFWQTIEP